MVEIRTAIARDAELLAEFAERTFRQAFAANNSKADMDMYCGVSFSPEVQAVEINDDAKVTLLCEEAGVLVGYAQVSWQDKPNCLASAESPGELKRLYVHGDFHGKGIAHILMDQVLHEMAQRDTDVAWLGVWEHNPRAISFYNKFDFTAAGDHEFYLGSDLQRDIIMSRPV